MVEKTLDKVLIFFNIKATITETEFRYYHEIPPRHNGIYVLSQGDQVIYVGKGQIKKRQGTHWNKAFNTLSSGQTDPSGWKWLRENIEIDPANWVLRYILLYKQTELTAVEGALIHLLQPLANDETFKDENRTLKEQK